MTTGKKEGFWDKVGRKVDQGLDKIGAKVKGVIDEAIEKPQICTYVDELINKIDLMAKDKRLSGPENEEALQHAIALGNQLKQARKTFERDTQGYYNLTSGTDTSTVPKLNAAIHAFAKASVDAIHEHQPKIMAAPGVWNQIKAWVNNVLEEYLNIKDALKVKESGVAQSSTFKDKFENVKAEGKQEVEDIEENIFKPR
ncbi:hypothetical protein ACTAZI_16785 [Legionella bozemanae]|uniref:hypothetical protein n=1 Tax=Legionella bozemanae TaxID=447 RepID=UPI003EEF1698